MSTTTQLKPDASSRRPWKIATKITGNGPYTFTKHGLPGHRCIIENDEIGIAEVAGETELQCLDNAALICSAVNEREQFCLGILEALQTIISCTKPPKAARATGEAEP